MQASRSQGDYLKAECIHCHDVVRSGKEGARRKECYNSSMMAHLKAKHKEIMLQVITVCMVCRITITMILWSIASL